MYASNHQSVRRRSRASSSGLTGMQERTVWREGLKAALSDLYLLRQPAGQVLRPVSLREPVRLRQILPARPLREFQESRRKPYRRKICTEASKTVRGVVHRRSGKDGLCFHLPVLTACLLLDEDGSVRDEEFLEWLSSVNSKYGMINIYMSKNADSLSSCCRLRNDLGTSTPSVRAETASAPSGCAR